MNVGKKKDRPFFNDRSNQVVFRSVGNLYRIFSAICSPYCLCCSISVRLSPSCRMLSGRWKSWMSGSNPGGMQSGFRPVQRISQYDANALQPLPCIYAPSRRTFVRWDGVLRAIVFRSFPVGHARRPRYSLMSIPQSCNSCRRRGGAFPYQLVDKTLTFHFLRATLELPSGQRWPRGNFCLGGSLCRKLKKKR